jgi:cytidylate kinase
MTTPTTVIAIDGPAASGKSSTARAVAERLGLVHIDSGALYRTAAWLAAQAQLEQGAAIASMLANRQVELDRHQTSLGVLVDGEPVDLAIRGPAVTAAVSAVAAQPEVREWVNQILRRAAAAWGGVVMDGRDIGTAVFPDAPLKVFLTASPESRARRRLLQHGFDTDPAAVAEAAAELAERDRRDAGREVAPLRQASDALTLDTTELNFTEQVDRILAWARSRGLSPT